MAKKQPKPSTSKPWKQQQKDKGKQARAAQREQQAAQVQQAAAQPRETPRLPWPAPRQPAELRDQYRYLNPYNFVRYLPEPDIVPDDPDAQLLGRCAPPPHDRYVGLTGRITCTLETVTPLFISDSHEVKEQPVTNAPDKKHKSYRFFQYEGKDAIPATSLRGMVRSTFEAVTNSSFSVFDVERRLDFREVDVAQDMKAA